MEEIKCPTCGRTLKYVKEPSEPGDKKTVTVHCNKCNTDVVQEV